MTPSRERKSARQSNRRGMLLSVSLASGAALLLALQGMVNPIFSYNRFMVEEIDAQWPPEMKLPPERYRLNPPTSIFRVDLGMVSQALQKGHPGVAVEAVRRVLPNRLVAALRPFKIIAQVKTDRYYPVSEQRIVVGRGEPSPWPHLPILYPEGVRRSFRVGETCQYPGFWQTSELLATIHRQGGVAGHGVSSVRSTAEQIVLSLDTGLEIRFSCSRLWPGWQQLIELLAQKQGFLEAARYVDLRFEDPVIGGPLRKKK